MLTYKSGPLQGMVSCKVVGQGPMFNGACVFVLDQAGADLPIVDCDSSCKSAGAAKGVEPVVPFAPAVFADHPWVKNPALGKAVEAHNSKIKAGWTVTKFVSHACSNFRVKQ